MISLRQRVLWAGVLASAAFAASAQTPPAAAQPAAPVQAQSAAPAKPHAERKDFAKRFERMQQRRAERMAALKDKLKLSTAQEGAWNTYAAAVQPSRDAKPPQRPDRAAFSQLTTPERLDRMQARQAERAALFAKRADAIKAFYAQLSPEQQKTFDAEGMRMGPRGHGHHRHHGPRHQPAGGEAGQQAPKS